MNNFTFTFILLVILLEIDSLYPQVTQDWVARYTGPGIGWDIAYDIAVDNNGNVYVTGMSQDLMGSAITTIKYSNEGITQWIAQYPPAGGEGTGWGEAIAVDAYGSVYVTGWGGVGNTNYITIKYNNSGELQWAPEYDGPANSNDYAVDIAIDNSGNTYVTGYSEGSGTGMDYATIKYNSRGVQLWAARYNGPGNLGDYAHSVAVDGSGNVYITGNSVESDPDYATVKYNSNGEQQWVSRYNGPGNSLDGAFSLTLDNSGYVYVTGGSIGDGTDWDCATIKYKNTGGQIWAARYDQANSLDEGRSVKVDNLSNVYVTGRTWHGYGLDTEDMLTLKYNENGIRQWVKTYNGGVDNMDAAFDIALSNQVISLEPDIYITGETRETSPDNPDYCTIKYNASGVQQWLIRYDGPVNELDVTTSLAIDQNNNVYVTGTSIGNGTSQDYATIKYTETPPCCGPTEMKIENNKLPHEYQLYQNYPNPFNPITTIKFDLPNTSTARLTIYDILGREILLLIDKVMQAGSYEYTLDASKYTSGIYFYKLNADNFVKINKMILIK